MQAKNYCGNAYGVQHQHIAYSRNPFLVGLQIGSMKPELYALGSHGVAITGKSGTWGILYTARYYLLDTVHAALG